MIVKLNKKVIGEPIFDMTYLREEIIEVYNDKEQMYMDEIELGYIKKLKIKPNSVKVVTSLKHIIEYEEAI